MWKITENIFRTELDDGMSPPTCFRLISARYYSILPDYLEMSLSFSVCPTGFEFKTFLSNGVLVTMNECLDLNTLEINEALSGITQLQVENAITFNSGLINTQISNGAELIGSITLTFTACETLNPPMLAYRSGGFSDQFIGCSQSLSIECQVSTQSGTLAIQSGDKAYYADGVTPFIGDSQYYKVQLAIANITDPSYVCFIDSLGNINVDTICI